MATVLPLCVFKELLIFLHSSLSVQYIKYIMYVVHKLYIYGYNVIVKIAGLQRKKNRNKFLVYALGGICFVFNTNRTKIRRCR
jgi:hypothetical protein